MRLSPRVVATLLLLLFATDPVQAADQVVMRISHQVPPAHHLTKILNDFAQEVSKRSHGTVKVQLFGSQQAFKAAENFPAVAKGSIEGALSVNMQWGNTIPEMNVVLIPYLFTDLDRIKKFPGSEAAKLLDAKLLQHGVKNIAWFYITRESIFTSQRKPIIKTEDFEGVKIRGLNRLVDHALTAVGAAPSALPGPEVYQALQTGVLDAGITDLSAAYSRRYYEVQKYGTVAPFFTVYFHLYVNPGWWNGLTPAQRTAIEGAAHKAERDSIAITEETAHAAYKELQEKGMVLHRQTPEEIAAWKAAMQKPVMDAFLKSAPDAAKLVALMKKL